MKTSITIFLILELITALIFSGYEFGLYQAKKKAVGRILNEHFREHEGRPQVCSDEFMRLTEAERDSFRLDAVNQLNK